jgi:hypothetical protein
LLGSKPFEDEVTCTWRTFYSTKFFPGGAPIQFFTPANSGFIKGLCNTAGIDVTFTGYGEDDLVTFVFDGDQSMKSVRDDSPIYLGILNRRRNVIVEVIETLEQDVLNQATKAGLAGTDKKTFILDWFVLRTSKLPAVLTLPFIEEIKNFFAVQGIEFGFAYNQPNDHIFQMII